MYSIFILHMQYINEHCSLEKASVSAKVSAAVGVHPVRPALVTRRKPSSIEFSDLGYPGIVVLQ